MAAVDAMDRPGLAFTNVGRGLALALDMHEMSPPSASRAILLVSDGAAVVDRKVQDKIRAAFAKRPINFVLAVPADRRRQRNFRCSMPPTSRIRRRHFPNGIWISFFKSLKIPYRAFEAENPEALAEAIAEIGRLEKKPITYFERVPQKDLAHLAFGIAFAAVLLLLAAKAIEVPIAMAMGGDRERRVTCEMADQQMGSRPVATCWVAAVHFRGTRVAWARGLAGSTYQLWSRSQQNSVLKAIAAGEDVAVDPGAADALVIARAQSLDRRDRFDEAQAFIDSALPRLSPDRNRSSSTITRMSSSSERSLGSNAVIWMAQFRSSILQRTATSGRCVWIRTTSTSNTISMSRCGWFATFRPVARR